MWLLPVWNAAFGALFKMPHFGHHGTLTGLTGPTMAFTTVKGHSMGWPWAANLTPYEQLLNEQPKPKAAEANAAAVKEAFKMDHLAAAKVSIKQ
jgi:hypothetical protein